MNETLQRWRDDFAREPDTAFDRLVRGLVPLGGASQLSFGEILDALFEPGDAVLDSASAGWLTQHLLAQLPEHTSMHRWASILEEYFRGIASMDLPQTGEILRLQHKRLRLWLHGFYEGPDRDPEGAYLLALARAQDSQHFSSLWRRLILGEDLAGRPYLGIGILGFRKMPVQNGQDSPGVPDGLLKALVELADKHGTAQAKWKQTMRSLFATYRRSPGFWVERLAPLLPHHQQDSHARDWLTALLPGIRTWRPQPAEQERLLSRRVRPLPKEVTFGWIERVRQDPSLCDTPEFSDFLSQHRAYAETTGNPEFINKTFNNLSTAIVRGDRHRADLAVSLMEEALEWAPWNPHNWTSYAIVLCDANRTADAIAALWKARHRFPFNPVIRNELGRILRENGDLKAAEGVMREAVAHFPNNTVCRNGFGETLREIGRLDDAREVFEQTRRDFPDNTVCRTGLGDLLIDMDDEQAAAEVYREALTLDACDRYARGGLARALSVLSARRQDTALRDEAKGMLQDLADEGNHDARARLRDFDDQWQRATTDRSVKFRRETDGQSQPARQQPGRAISDMSIAERLGRAMIALWQAERAEDAALRDSLCTHATALLDVPEDQIDDELLAAFVETRGLVLLASDDARRALAYFEEQIRSYGRGGWIGIRLGEQRARIILGEPATEADTAEPPISQSARFALHVARVIEALSRTPQESEVRELLKALYPSATAFAARTQPDAEGNQHIENGAEMLGAFMQTRWFRPAGIESIEDLDQPDRLNAVIERINTTRTDTFDVISNATLEIAA